VNTVHFSVIFQTGRDSRERIALALPCRL